MLLRGTITTGEDDSPENISLTEYSLQGTSYEWAFDNYDTEVIIINSKEELESYIVKNDLTEETYPEIDFSKHTLLLVHGACTNGISEKRVVSFQMSAEEQYRLDIEIILNMTEEAPIWTMALLSDKLSDSSSIELLVHLIF